MPDSITRDQRRNAEGATPPPDSDAYMGSIDRAWLAMDRPHNPMIVTAVLELDRVHDVTAFAEAVFARLCEHDRFRQRIDDVRQPHAWRFVEALDPGYHVQVRRRVDVRSAADLKADIGAEIGRALDPAFPLWRLILYPLSRRRVVVLFRAHHAMADGISLMRLLLRLMDGSPGPAAADTRRSKEGPLSGLIERLSRLNGAWVRARRIDRIWFGDAAAGRDRIKALAGAAAAIGRTLSRQDNRPAALCGVLQGHRRLDWSEALPLSPLRERAHALDVTLNDLFLAALAGAIGHYLRSLGPVDAHCDVRVSIPVNLRAADDDSLGNQFGLVLLDLPVGEEDAARRRVLVGARMRRLKGSMEAKAVLAALGAVGRLPASAGKYLVDQVASKACAVVSNLPGPDRILQFGGARLARAIFLPPQTGEIGLGISILTYAGRVSLAVCADTGVLADPALLLRPFEDELKSLIGAAIARPHRAETAHVERHRNAASR